VSLAELRRCLPARGDVWAVFLAIVFPINFWSVIFFLRELPSYLMRMRVWDILGVLAYTQVIALLDSLFLLAILLGATFLLPIPSIRKHFIVAGTAAAFIAILGVVPFHYKAELLQSFPALQQSWVIWGWAAFLVLLLVGAVYALLRSPRIENRLRNFLDRLAVLSSAYLVFSLLALLVVIVRNLGWH
jgi:hypothetical protein